MHHGNTPPLPRSKLASPHLRNQPAGEIRTTPASADRSIGEVVTQIVDIIDVSDIVQVF